MKIRNGFVSNSSSSSFVVAFSHKPESVEELKKMMFPDKSWTAAVKIYGESLTVAEVVEIVWKDLENQDGVDDGEILDLFTRGWESYETAEKSRIGASLREKADRLRNEVDQYVVDNIGSAPWWKEDNEEEREAYYKKKTEFIEKDEKYKELWENFCEASDDYRKRIESFRKAYGEKQFSLFKDRVLGKFLAVFEYADEDGAWGSVMEHAGIFDDIYHETFSHH